MVADFFYAKLIFFQNSLVEYPVYSIFVRYHVLWEFASLKSKRVGRYECEGEIEKLT